ncbi:uncharacterized protein GIQ15_05690 [Arthroderma uncinatum]|uniref:uncharacterized protein n=1 Tax=Arthroderma uncinatum TaxID=74035 RepID=UPI00144A8988|nr:uncharacterized protein GIQ15_05690 [Arthroderma uncinatum]KAF3480343.1 hypothetical protein GIQ15_05690 [Arthroderma uncinatum]
MLVTSLSIWLLYVVANVTGAVTAYKDPQEVASKRIEKLQRQYQEYILATVKARESGCTPKNMIYRQEWGSLSKRSRLEYINAVKCLQRKDPITPKEAAPGVKSRYDDFSATHIMQTPFIHFSDLPRKGIFLHFHRYFIWLYEKALREECGYRGAQPYWDWTISWEDPRKSKVFDGSPYSMGSNGMPTPHGPTTISAFGFSLDIPPGTGGGCVYAGPFRDYNVSLGPVAFEPKGEMGGLAYNPRCLTRDLSPLWTNNTKPSDIAALLTDCDDIGCFDGQLEAPDGGHSGGHFGIGGLCIDAYASAGDPAFWLHHAQVDRMWTIWQNLKPKTRTHQVWGTGTAFNNPPSANVTLDTILDYKVLAPKQKVGSIGSTIDGPFCYMFGSLDPFESYPQTRLPREHVQRLIHSFLSKIAFQYYPLDLNATSNPFLISWWPLALGDPALFHVSLQTACLDEELLAQKGFQTSDLLMADSVALLRRKVEDTTLAVQDGTINSVITLAAIEFGKGNTKVCEMHVEGVKRLINMRGGINSVRQTSPLTARMVSWVSMIVMGHPQFETQDDVGVGDGIPLIPEWQLDLAGLHDDLPSKLSYIEISYTVWNVFIRLRNAFKRAKRVPLPATQLHDLTCFVIHRLLLPVAEIPIPRESPITECIRYSTVLYMFIVQGPTYFSHAVIFNTILTRFMEYVVKLESESRSYDSLDWLTEKVKAVAASLHLGSWGDVLIHINSVLWLETLRDGDTFRPHWDAIFTAANPPVQLDFRSRWFWWYLPGQDLSQQNPMINKKERTRAT